MKILFALSMSLSRPGPSVHLLSDVIGYFEKDGTNDVTIIEKDFSATEITHHGNHIALPFKSTNKRFLFARYNNEIAYLKKIIQYLREKRLSFDAVFVQSSPVAYVLINYLKKYTKSKIIYNVQDIFPDNLILLNKRIAFLLLVFAKKALKAYEKSDLIITISDDMRDEIVKKGIKEEKVITIYNWAPTSILSKNNTINFFSKDDRLENKFIVMYAGNIGRFQDIDTILSAANLIHNEDIKFVIMGDGACTNRVHEKVDGEKIQNIVFYPPQNFFEMPRVYSSANINIVSLKKGIYRTALPSKLAFCMEAKKPIIFSIEKESKVGKLFSNQSLVFICEPENACQMADAITEVYDLYRGGRLPSIDLNCKIHFDAISSDNYKKYKNAILTLFSEQNDDLEFQ